jgi:hypothetical protein
MASDVAFNICKVQNFLTSIDALFTRGRLVA